MRLSYLLYQAIDPTGTGKAFAAPVDVRFSASDQVQPDLLAIRKDKLDICEGHIVRGAPDIVVEILSPSSSRYDEVEKERLYASGGVPEYWIVGPVVHRLTIYQFKDGDYVPVKPENGVLKSTAVVDFTIDLAALFANTHRE